MHQTYSPIADGQVASQKPQVFFSVALQDSGSELAQHEQKSSREDAIIRRPHLYQPVWLTKRVLASFILFFSAFWVTLVVLWHIVSVQDGLVLTLTSNYYAWTYGPTAILIIVLSFWRQIDYHCKVSQPWREMMAGCCTAECSLLLDYISPPQVFSLYKSFRRKHYTVTMSVAGFLLLKLTVLISTVLLLPEQTLRSEAGPISYTTAFNASSFWETFARDQTKNSPDPEYLQTNFTQDILWRSVKQLNGQDPDPALVKDNKVLQAFTTRTSHDNITAITADIDLFVPNVTCEEARAERRPVGDSVGIYALYLDSGSCYNQFVDFFNSYPDKTRGDFLEFFETTVDCSESHDDRRIVVVAVNASQIKSADSKEYKFHDRITAVLCKLDFSMSKANATLQLSSNSVNLANMRLNAGTPVNLTGLALTRIVDNTLFDGGGEQLKVDWPAGAAPKQPVMFPMMLKHLKTQNWGVFFDQNTLKQSATSIFELLMLQFASSQLLQPASHDGEGYITVSQQKLHIRAEPFISMIVCFAILTCFTVVSMLLLRRRVLPQKFGSIASHATVLTSNPALANILDGTGNERTSGLWNKLNGLKFTALVSEQNYSIDISHSTEEPHQPKSSSATTKHDNWMPFAARTSMLTLTFVSALVIIGVLEVLQRLSDRNNGIIEIAERNYNVVYILRYCSILIIFSLATLFNNLDFAITTFASFSTLRSATKPAERTVLVNLIGEAPIVALYQSITLRYYWTSLSILSALLGSALPIVLSGLWKVDNQVVLPTVVTATTDTWNLTWANESADDKGASQMLNIIDKGGATEPASIWQNSVLPNISKLSYAISNTSAGTNNNLSSDFEFPLLSLRPELDCIVAPEGAFSHQNVSVNRLGGDPRENWQLYNASFPIPAACSPGSSINSRTVVLNYTDDGASYFGGDILVGFVYDLDIFPATATANLTQHADELAPKKECPSLGFVFGHSSNATAIICSQKLVKVPMRVKYKDDPSSNKVDAQQPPAVESVTDPELALDPITGYATHQYKIEKHVQTGLMFFRGTMTTPFFDHLINGPYQIKQETILGRENADNLIAAINMLYNKYMTLVIDMNFRSSAVAASNTASNASNNSSSANSPNPTTVRGTASRQVSRLRIDKASKLALQIMIATMTLFMAVAVKKAKIRKTLPRNPCNIASVMGFLAGSALCDPERTLIPPGSEFLDKRGMAKLFKGRMVSLRWWPLSNVVPSEARNEAGREASQERESEGDALGDGIADHDASMLRSSVDDRSRAKSERFGIDLVLGDDDLILY